MKYWKKRPRVMIDQTRSPRPATIRTIPAANGQTRPPGHGRPPGRPSTSASTTQPAMAGSKMKALRSTVAGPRDRKRWRTRITNSNAAQTTPVTVNTVPAAPCWKTRGTTTPPVHHPAAASGVAAQTPGREPGGPRRRRPGRDREQLWQAATVLREHRGDGHFAAVATADIDGCEVLVLRCGLDMRREDLQPIRGWTDEQWDAARARLAARGWTGPDGGLAPAGRAAPAAGEHGTGQAAARPWARLGPAAVADLAE